MDQTHPNVFFDQQRAEAYDTQFARMAPMREALYLLMGAVLQDLPVQTHLLCVGAGTGAEILHLAGKFPQWKFTAVDPSGPMLQVCRRRIEEAGLASRCSFHEGFLDTLPEGDPFDAATSLLVSQFILSREARSGFFSEVARRLRPGGLLINSDLTADVESEAYRSLLEVWLKLMQTTGISPENVNRMKEAYARDVSILPAEEVSGLMAEGGFETPVLFLQTGLIHAWYARMRS